MKQKTESMICRQGRKNTQAKQKKIKKEKSLRNIWENMKCNNICIMGTPEEERQEIENLFEDITENLPNWMKDKDT